MVSAYGCAVFAFEFSRKARTGGVQTAGERRNVPLVVVMLPNQMRSVRRVLIAGGDSSSYAARSLGIEAVEMIAPLAPGAPLCSAHAPGSPADGIEVNFKGGQVGAEDYFGAVALGGL